MWLLLVLFQTTTFAIVTDSESDCYSLARISLPLWKEATGDVSAVCMKTYEI